MRKFHPTDTEAAVELLKQFALWDLNAVGMEDLLRDGLGQTGPTWQFCCYLQHFLTSALPSCLPFAIVCRVV